MGIWDFGGTISNTRNLESIYGLIISDNAKITSYEDSISVLQMAKEFKYSAVGVKHRFNELTIDSLDLDVVINTL